MKLVLVLALSLSASIWWVFKNNPAEEIDKAVNELTCQELARYGISPDPSSQLDCSKVKITVSEIGTKRRG